jgi:Zn-dependent M28 family amino/carboxypeptidase
MPRLAAAVALLALAVATTDSPRRAAVLSPAERAAAAVIRAESLRGRIRFLASDLLEGRGPATRGDELAQAYVAAEMETIGLEAAGGNDTYMQPFDIVGIRTACPSILPLSHRAERLDLRYEQDFVVASGNEALEGRLENAEIVFVGYGIQAPEFRWDDYKGLDVRGKVLLMMNNDPEDDPQLFEGRKRLYYGRWTYKYEIAAKLGAAGALIIHTDASAGYGWKVVESSWGGSERFVLPRTGQPELVMAGWLTEDAARRAVRLGGLDLDRLRASAQRRDFRPMPLGVELSLVLRNEVRVRQTANVLGRLAGRDPDLGNEVVLYTAHYDHLGLNPKAKAGEDAIYNGAHDNASGVAAILAVAEAFRALPRPPKRTIVFAAVGAEEQGLLGSEYLASHPPVPVGRIAADINVDGINIFGRTRDLTMIGLGKSSLDDRVRAVLAAQGRVIVPDQYPDKGFFYRSDQFNFAKVGVPSAYFDNGTEVVGKPPGWGKQRQTEYEDLHYHQPSDELTSDWDFSGAVEDVRFFFYLGSQIANAPSMPAWRAGDEFETARQRALAAP